MVGLHPGAVTVGHFQAVRTIRKEQGTGRELRFAMIVGVQSWGCPLETESLDKEGMEAA